MTAAIAVLLFRMIKQPLVLGYLIAGFLAGNHFDFFPSVKDMHSVEVWAQIGIIFLLFSLGLEFSFRKLMKVGGTASITAVTQILLMTCFGYGTGRLMGWSSMDSIFLGVIVSVSSTTIILKTFDELGVKAKRFAGIVIGSLIVQDIVAILMMVLLSTVAVSNQFSGMELLMSVLKLLFFLTLWFVCGIFFIPTLLKRAKNLLTDEMLLIISIALCLVMVILASGAGFSPALGAFIMGSIIAETTQAEHIEHLVKPVKDLFAAVFFVSVGMLIDPNTLTEHIVPVGILTLLVIIGQPIASTFGALLSGQPLRQSVQTGMSLSQIGEFSFIIATLGSSLHVTSKFLYPIVVAVSAITTFTTPFMVKWSTPMAEYLGRILPRKWLKRIERYSANAQSIKSASNWQIVLRAYILQVVLHSVIIIGGILLSRNFFLPIVDHYGFGHALAAFVTLAALAPFFWALSLRRVAVEQVTQLMAERRYRGPIVMMVLFRFVLALFYIGFLLDNFFSAEIAFLAFCACIIVYSIFPKKLNKQYHRIETRFLNNLNAREIIKMKRQRSDLTPWEGHMTLFDISRESNIAGHTLEELQFREQMGVNIAFIKRGEVTINIPARNERLFPGDEICVIGTDEQVDEFKKYLERNEIGATSDNSNSEIVLQQFEIGRTEFAGKSIRQSQIREKTKGLVVGVERGGNRILNPDSHLILEQNDILWIVGDKKLLGNLRFSD
ncbi:cation:proton antiporter domain-containing protein [Flavobacterium silvaticum]|uniref:Sodium:proton antiporter n=1 Tax=Flavobacterium silvaticum TaxID=1852020 RepID=A0A972FJ77_9FLAO|nr:cation:proton antiporter [Flavobacterium silvaticum]NMH26763.1 sodium:proton antiporter [Flavobacterium silvaticum]